MSRDRFWSYSCQPAFNESRLSQLRHPLALGALILSSLLILLPITPARALALGSVTVESALGQPLRASIPVELGPGELLNAGCVSVPAAARPQLGALPQAAVTVPEAAGPGRFSLLVTTSRALHEPMYELQLQIRCADAPLLMRQYVLLLDLPGAASPPTATILTQGAATGTADRSTTGMTSGPAAPQTAPAPAASIRRQPLSRGSSYAVATGDTLLGIAARVMDRNGASLWQVAERIFAANPAAFINNNPDLIRLGSSITIPSMDVDAATSALASSAAGTDATGSPGPAVDTAEARPALTPSSQPFATLQNSESATALATASLPANGTGTATENDATTSPGTIVTGDSPQQHGAQIFADEAADAGAIAAAAATTPEDSGSAGHPGAPAWLAILIGIFIGAAVSLALLRERLLAVIAGPRQEKGILQVPERRPDENAIAETTPAAPVRAPLKFNHLPGPQESSMVVEEHPADELTDELELDTTAADHAIHDGPATDESVTVEHIQPPADELLRDIDALAELRGRKPDLALAPVEASGQEQAPELDLDLSAASLDNTLDQDISWIGDDTALSPTIQTPTSIVGTAASDTMEQLDLQTLSQQVGEDPAISQTLKDALELLESDYEDEWTSAREPGQDTLRDLFGDDDLDDTFVRTGTDLFPHRR